MSHMLNFSDLELGLGYSNLLCPYCSETWIHIDDVYIAGRPREDGEIHPVHVNAQGAVDKSADIIVPFGSQGAGRRHTITLAGWCEMCGARFAVAFQQHKGQTHVSTVRQQWIPD